MTNSLGGASACRDGPKRYNNCCRHEQVILYVVYLAVLSRHEEGEKKHASGVVDNAVGVSWIELLYVVGELSVKREVNFERGEL